MREKNQNYNQSNYDFKKKQNYDQSNYDQSKTLLVRTKIQTQIVKKKIKKKIVTKLENSSCDKSQIATKL